MEKIRFQKNSDEMMRVISEQKKSLYLKAYVGSVYKDGVWRKMPEGQDPLQWFLTTSRTGNQMLYASAAVEAYPCTWNSSKIRGRILSWSIQNPRQQKWRGIYYRGECSCMGRKYILTAVGWKAVDVTPGYYYRCWQH